MSPATTHESFIEAYLLNSGDKFRFPDKDQVNTLVFWERTRNGMKLTYMKPNGNQYSKNVSVRFRVTRIK